ncbi:MAG: glycosyltransferase family 2 protein [Janthinobacterium lividum]
MTRRLISVISPCFNEEDNVEACHETVRDLFRTDPVLQRYDLEHIFADNSSSDTTVAKLREIAARDPNVRVIVNARNYGPFRSTFNALRRAKGDAVIPMLPVDLQDPPELIPAFVKKWEEGFLRVYGIRTQRQEGAVMRFVRRRYYATVNRFSNIEIPENVAEFQIIDRQVLDALLQFKDYYPYIRGMLANVGFARDSASIEYTWRERRSGMSKNRFFNLVDQGLNGMISFTNAPMRIAIFFGFGMAALSFAYGLFQLVLNILQPDNAPPGIATLIVALFFLSGVQLALLGVLGEYISAIHFQVRQGDIVVEREVINMEPRSPSRAATAAPFGGSLDTVQGVL